MLGNRNAVGKRYNTQSLWDTFTIAQATPMTAGQTVNMFQVARGGAITDLDTNLTKPGTIPMDAFSICGMRLYVYSAGQVPTVIADLNDILNCLLVKLEINSKTIYEFPAIDLLAGVGVVSASASAVNAGTNGVPSRANFLEIDPEPVTKTDNLAVKVVSVIAMTGGAPAVATRVRLYLDGFGQDVAN